MDTNKKFFFRIKSMKYEYFTILFLLIPIISCNFITMKFKGTGEEQIYMNAIKERPCPNNIIVDGESISDPTCKYKFPKKIVTIQINLNKNMSSFNRMFSDISNIIEIDLTQTDTSLIENMAYMFENCNSLIFANLSNINTSSLVNIEKMFSNCKSLKSLDLTNIDISKIPNHKDIFNNCIQLKKNYLNFKNSERLLEQSSETPNEGVVICDIYNMFNESRTCQIDVNGANEDIIRQLKQSSYREFLIDNVLNNRDEISLSEGNENFSIISTLNREKIDLNGCEVNIRNYYNITDDEILYIYKHEINIPDLYMPIINFEVFNKKYHFNISCCDNRLIYFYIPVNISEEELYKLNPSDEYYSENCTNGDKSLYERKQEYNEQNLALCQTNCKFYNYNYATKSVTCNCFYNTSNIEQNSGYFDKFELKEEDKYKCKILSTDIDEFSLMFETMINGLITNKTGKDKELVFDDMIKGVTNGSLDQIINQVVNNKKDFVMSADGDTYHLTTVKQQYYTQHLSAVDLGDCEKKLRQDYSLGDQELLIFKVDHYVPSFKIPIIEYVLFTENGRMNINLDSCKGIPINYYLPVNISNDKLYLYDPNNEFYNDKCHQHTSEGGTDMTIYDRKNEYNVQNMSLCENGCEFGGYNETNSKTKCTCPIKTERNFFEIDQDKLLNKFKNYKDITNIMIVKCYKLVFSSKGLKKNIGSYIIISIAVINGSLIAFFYLKGFKNLNTTMKQVLNKSFKEKEVNAPPNKKKKKRKRKSVKSKYVDTANNLNPVSNDIEVKEIKRTNTKKSKSKKFKKSEIENKRKKPEEKEKQKKEEVGEDEIIYFNDYELNNLSYDEALLYETRTYWEYYLSLLKTKHLIIFTFYTKTDYNSKPLKIILFLISFALFYTVNALFFNDSTMHQIYEDEGSFNFIYQIPQILYSTIISTAIKMIVSFLSLTEKDFIKIKSKKSKKIALEEFNLILKRINKKCIIFFSLSYLFIIFFWYYLSCFCAVYKNTQVYLIKDTVISFATSLLYPFPINLIPGLLRMPALKYKKKCLYIISTFVALI